MSFTTLTGIASSAHPSTVPLTGPVPPRHDNASHDTSGRDDTTASADDVSVRPSALERYARRFNEITDGTAIPPVSPPTSAAAPVRLAAPDNGKKMVSTMEFVEQMFGAAKSVKEGFLADRTNATKVLNQFYSDLTNTTAHVDQMFVVKGDKGDMELPRNKALALYAKLYMKWIGTPIGEVKADGIDQEQWEKFSVNFEFRDVTVVEGGKKKEKKMVFLKMDELTDKLLEPIFSKHGDFEIMPIITSEKDRYLVLPERMNFLESGKSTKNILQSFISRSYFIANYTKTKKYPVISEKWKNNLPISLRNKTEFRKVGGAGITNYDSIERFNRVYDLIERGLELDANDVVNSSLPRGSVAGGLAPSVESWIKDAASAKSFNATQVSHIRSIVNTEVSAWQQVSGAMLQTAQQAQSLSDRMYQLLTEIARSMFEGDKQFVTTN